MYLPPSWETRFKQELEQAETARLSGNEGRARVCARRAAGIAAGEYLSRSGIRTPASGAYNHLRRLQELPGLRPEVYALVVHFTTRVSQDFRLPIDADLIAEARLLTSYLFE